MGEHRSNPRAQHVGAGGQVVQYMPIGDGLGLLPGMSIGWVLDEAKENVLIVAALTGVKDSPIAGGAQVAAVPIGTLLSTPLSAVKEALLAMTGHKPEPEKPSLLLAG
ncbi:MAG: hypothetical protein V4510_11465 [bacterium]